MANTHHHAHDIPNPKELKDPVCGMKLRPASPHQYAYQGQMFFFCNLNFLDKFRADPPHYLQNFYGLFCGKQHGGSHAD